MTVSKKTFLILLFSLILVLVGVLFLNNFFHLNKEDKAFDMSSIDYHKLNKQLILFTNRNIVEEENNRREKEEEENKIKKIEENKIKTILQKEEKKISEEKKLLFNKQVELKKQKEELKILKKEMINSKKLLEEIKTKELRKKDDLILLLRVKKIEGKLYKSYLDKVVRINSSVKLCRDNSNKIELLYGPFDNKNIRNDLYEKFLVNNFKSASKIELSKEDFDRRCNY